MEGWKGSINRWPEQRLTRQRQFIILSIRMSNEALNKIILSSRYITFYEIRN